MIIYPDFKYDIICPNCRNLLRHMELVWQGIHVCTDSICDKCGKIYLCDLPCNQATVTPFICDKEKSKYIALNLAPNKDGAYDTRGGWTNNKNFFTGVFEGIIKRPKEESINFEIKKFKEKNKIIILNTLDYLYGHSLLFFLNSFALLKDETDYGLVIIIQPWLKWLIPDGVAEVWLFELNPTNSREYYKDISNTINSQITRFQKVKISRGDVQPKSYDISKFTGVPVHNFGKKEYRINFIWRQDSRRMWFRETLLVKICRKMRLLIVLKTWQVRKVIKLSKLLKKRLPMAKITISGLGKYGKMPDWIDDFRIDKFDDYSERQLCKVYSESRIAIGVHGSNMILPSAHAGMAICLMPQKRWNNFVQDLTFNENDDRLSLYQKRVYPIEVSIKELVDIIEHMIEFREDFIVRMVKPFISRKWNKKKKVEL